MAVLTCPSIFNGPSPSALNGFFSQFPQDRHGGLPVPSHHTWVLIPIGRTVWLTAPGRVCSSNVAVQLDPNRH